MVEIINDRITLLRTSNAVRDINNYLTSYRSLDRILYVSEESSYGDYVNLTVYSINGIVSSYILKDTIKRCCIDTLVLTSFDLTTIAILEEVEDCNLVLALDEVECSKFLSYFDRESKRGVVNFEEACNFSFNGGIPNSNECGVF